MSTLPALVWLREVSPSCCSSERFWPWLEPCLEKVLQQLFRMCPLRSEAGCSVGCRDTLDASASERESVCARERERGRECVREREAHSWLDASAFAADPDYWKGEVFAYVGRNQNLGPKGRPASVNTFPRRSTW